MDKNSQDAIEYYDQGKKFPKSPMHEAVQAGDINKIRALIEKGVSIDVNAGPNPEYKAVSGTPLHHAVFVRDIARINLCFAFGADPNITDRQGFTPLHIACGRQGYIEPCWAEGIALLIRRGANVNAKNNKRTTPLMMAACSGGAEGIRILLENGATATMNSRWEDGSNALDDAIRALRHLKSDGVGGMLDSQIPDAIEVIEILKSYGAKPGREREERVKSFKHWNIGDKVYDPVKKMYGVVKSITENPEASEYQVTNYLEESSVDHYGERVTVQYSNGEESGVIRADDLWEAAAPSPKDMGQMFKLEQYKKAWQKRVNELKEFWG